MTVSQLKGKWRDRLSKLLMLSPGKIAAGLVLFSLFSMFRHYQRLNSRNSFEVDWVGILERSLLDIRFKMRGPQPVSQGVGILAIDERSVAKFGRWPFPRAVWEPAIRNLKKAGVDTIGFDVIFSEPERPYLDESIEGIQEALSASAKPKGFDANVFGEAINVMLESSPGDVALGKALKDFGNIVHGYFYFEKGTQIGLKYDWMNHYATLKNGSALDFVSFDGQKKLKDYPELLERGAITNTSVIAGPGSSMGFFNNQADPDGIIRNQTMVRGLIPVDASGNDAGDPILLPSLSLATAAKYLQREIVVKFDDYAGIKSIELMDPEGERNPIVVPVSQDGSGRIGINHYGPAGTFPHISLADAYDNKLSKKLPQVLLVGAVGTGLADIRPSPFDEKFNGVEGHTASLENILSENYLRRPLQAIFLEMALLVVTGIFFGTLLYKASAVTSALMLVAFSVSYFLIDRYFIFGRGQYMYMGVLYLQNFSLFFSVTLFKYFTEEKEKKKIKNAFQHYLNPSVINQLMDNPEALKLGGEKKELTVFFSDVRGFTTISETLSPEALSSLLNEYFTPMTNIILESGGLLDKYIGDAVMAVWGAPIPLADHPDRALIASLQMLDTLDELRLQWKARGLPLIDIGCGINTGPMVVGNMGSNQRFDYTVLGDAVNLGARLEGVTKQYGVKILCSEMTVKSLKQPNRFMLRELDSIQVKGKTEPVRIFECMRVPNGMQQACHDIAGLFQEGLQNYRMQKWGAAEEKFNEILRISPTDGPATEFLTRCQYLREHLPEANWDGVWVMKSK